MSEKQELQEIIVERDNGKDYKFQGVLLVDEQHEPNTDFQTEYWCGIIQVYYVEYEKFNDKEKAYILVTRRHQGAIDDNDVTVTEAGFVVNGIMMVISLILSRFKDDGTIPKWVKRAIDTLKESDHNDKGGQYEELKEYKGEE